MSVILTVLLVIVECYSDVNEETNLDRSLPLAKLEKNNKDIDNGEKGRPFPRWRFGALNQGARSLKWLPFEAPPAS